MYATLIENKDIKEYFDLEVKFNVMIADINKIIAEAIKDVLQEEKYDFTKCLEYDIIKTRIAILLSKKDQEESILWLKANGIE